MFTPLTPHPEMGIRMAAKFGFHGIEPWGNELQKYLTQHPAVFKQAAHRKYLVDTLHASLKTKHSVRSYGCGTTSNGT